MTSNCLVLGLVDAMTMPATMNLAEAANTRRRVMSILKRSDERLKQRSSVVGHRRTTDAVMMPVMIFRPIGPASAGEHLPVPVRPFLMKLMMEVISLSTAA